MIIVVCSPLNKFHGDAREHDADYDYDDEEFTGMKFYSISKSDETVCCNCYYIGQYRVAAHFL